MIPQILEDSKLSEHKSGGYLLELPKYTISDYAGFKNQMQQIGGVWKNGKGFYFQEDPTILLNWLKKGNLDFKKKNNFYATPDDVAFEMVQNIHLYNGIKILEPSAGQGVFVKALIERFMNDEDLEEMEVHFCEIDEYNYMFLEKLELWCAVNNGVRNKKLKLKGYFGDFLTLDLAPIYDLVIGNPPFTGAENHIKKMINCLAGEKQGDCSNIEIILPMGFSQVKKHQNNRDYTNDDYKENTKLSNLLKHPNFNFYTSIHLLDKKTFSKAMANVSTAVFSISGIFNEGSYTEEEEEEEKPQKTEKKPKIKKEKTEKVAEKPKEIEVTPQPEIINQEVPHCEVVTQESEITPQQEVKKGTSIPKPQLSLF
jgi:hypothetical protein